MPYHPGDTIAAISTAPGGAARGIVRVSGREAVSVVSRCFFAGDGTTLEQIAQPSVVVGHARVWVRRDKAASHPTTPPYDGGESFVPCDAFVWPTNRSYTREPVVELHTLGSPPLLEALLADVCRAGARLAEPGEFTLRAFLAGRLDLTQAEAVLGVIDARGDTELQAALTQLAGGLAAPLHRLRDDLLQLLAELEAGLDFVDEDIEFVTSQALCDRTAAAAQLLNDAAEQLSKRHTSNQFAQIALVGPPNVGKSSLFNALVARYGVTVGANQTPSAALVSPQRGTTRDYLTAAISLDGIRCELIDTAGVETPSSEVISAVARPLKRTRPRVSIEAAARAISTVRGAGAWIRAHCVDALALAAGMETGPFHSSERCDPACDVIVVTKSDLAAQPVRLPVNTPTSVQSIVTSSHTGKGLTELGATLRGLIATEETAQPGKTVVATADRCRESIRLAQSAVAGAQMLVLEKGGDELVAAELRAAIEELGKVVGTVYTNDLLDRIFKTFCIGK